MESITTTAHSLCVGMEFGELEFALVDEEEQQLMFTENVRDTVCDTTKLMK